MRKLLAFALMMSSIFFSLVISTYAAENNTPKLQIGSGSYAELNQFNLFSSGNQKIVSFSLKISNGSQNDLDLIDYWVKLRSSSGTQYSVNIIDEDKAKTKVAPNTSQVITYYSSVGKDVNTSNLIISLIKWDFSSADFFRTIGDIRPINVSSGNIDLGGVQVQAEINYSTIAQLGQQYIINSEIKFKNVGTKRATLPNTLKYYVQNQKGLTYQLSGPSDAVSIEAIDEAYVPLYAEFPVSAGKTGWKLYIVQESGTTKVEIPKASFNLVFSSTNNTSSNKSISFNSKQGKYALNLKRVQKLPWGDQDILAAEIEIKNEETKILKVPFISGQFKLDNVDYQSDLTKTVQLDNLLSIKPKGTTNVVVYTKVPYTYEYSDVEVILDAKEKPDSTTSQKIGNFKFTASELNLSVIKQDQQHIINQVGKRSGITIVSSYVYEGETSNLVYADLAFENKELRPATPLKFEGYVQMNDGSLFPATVSSLKEQVTPGGEALLGLWTEVPKKYANQTYKFILGEGIKDNKLNTGDTASDGIVNAIILEKSKTEYSIENKFDKLNINPYSISLKKIYATIDTPESMTFNFEYDLLNKGQYVAVPDKHSIVIELVSDKFKAEQEFVIEGTTDKSLKLGEAIGAQFSKTEPWITNKAKTTFILNVYDKFKDHKRLIASKELKWFEKYE